LNYGRGRGFFGTGGCRGAGCSFDKCFVAGTKVQTPEGEKNIEDVKVGDEVFAADPENGEEQALQVQEVLQTFVRTADAVVDINLETGEVITATPEHPFWTMGGGWVAAGQLVRGSPLQTTDGRILQVVGTTRRAGEFKVYNFEVAIAHTYFVGKSGVLVHNQCPPTIPRVTPGSLDPKEEKAVLETIRHIEAGTTPSWLSKTGQKKWGSTFKNNNGDLPGTPGAGGYREYDVQPPSGTSGRGPRRVVVGNDGKIYYTWTHYGDQIGPPFVWIR
jgi:hypothetical protein